MISKCVTKGLALVRRFFPASLKHDGERGESNQGPLSDFVNLQKERFNNQFQI